MKSISNPINSRRDPGGLPPISFAMIALAALLVLLSASESRAGSAQSFHHFPAEPMANLDSLFEAAVPLEDSPEGQMVLDSCLMTYGGTESLNRLKSVRMIWRMKALMSRDSLTVTKTIGGQRRYKIERQSPGVHEQRIINGSRAWFESNDTLIELSESRFKAELYSYLVMNMPLATQTEDFGEIRYGRRTDSPYHFIYMLKPDSLMIVLGISSLDYFIHSAEGAIFQNGDQLVFANYFSHFRRHDDYVFPHAMTNISMGLRVGQSVLKEVLINPPVTESDFAPSGLSQRLD